MALQLRFPDPVDEACESLDDADRRAQAPRLLITIREAAAALAIGRSTVYELINAGQLEVVHIGRSVRVPVDVIDDFISQLRRDG